MANTTHKVSKIIAYTALVLVLVLAIGAIAYFTNGFTSEFKTFYITVNGENVLATKKDVVLRSNQPMEVGVNYTFNNKESDLGYNVKVYPADNVDFDFTINGNVYAFSGEKDLSKGFEIDRKEKSFTITPKGNMRDILSAMYPDNEVKVNLEDIPTKDVFVVLVSSYDKKVSVALYCCVNIEATGIRLDKEVIVF